MHPGLRIGMDLHPLDEAISDAKHLLYLFLFVDRFSDMKWDFYLRNREAETILEAILQFVGILDRQYTLVPQTFECDNEFTRA